MNILFLGNCQTHAMRGLFHDTIPKQPTKFQTITPYWGVFNEELTRTQLAEADLVICQAIANPDTTFNVADVRASTKGDIVFMPYIYVDGIASLELIGSKGRSVIKGSDQILRGQEGRNAVKIFEDYCDGTIDMMGRERVEASLALMAQNEQAGTDIAISDYIADTWRKQPTLFGINHPTQPVLFEMFRRLCAHLGWKHDPAVEKDPIVWGKRALPISQRGLTPNDVKVLGLEYPCDTHWYGQGYKLMQLAIKAAEREAAERQASSASA